MVYLHLGAEVFACRRESHNKVHVLLDSHQQMVVQIVRHVGVLANHLVAVVQDVRNADFLIVILCILNLRLVRHIVDSINLHISLEARLTLAHASIMLDLDRRDHRKDILLLKNISEIIA